MLIRFNVGNFLSFRDVQSFSMVAGNSAEHPNHIIHKGSNDLLRSSFIYGPNSSGKSNLISAMYYSRNKILDLPMDFMRTDYKLFNSPRHVDKNGVEIKDPSYLEYIIDVDGSVYSYGFEIDVSLDIIMSEWLVKIGEGTEQEIFSMEYCDGEFKIECENQKILSLAQKYAEGKKEITFLKYIHEKYSDVSIDRIYLWFEKELMIRTSMHLNQTLMMDEVELSILEDIISKFDINIDKILINKSSFKYTFNSEVVTDTSLFGMVMSEIVKSVNMAGKTCIYFKNGDLYYSCGPNLDDSKSISFSHITNPNYKTRLSQESDGTIRTIKFVIDLVSDFEVLPKSDVENMPYTRTLVIDEIECGIHVKLLSELLVRAFDICKLPLQIIATTHETELLSKNRYRTDEIWFMDVREDVNDRQSVLYSLEEYKDIDKNHILDDYLSGIYGAVPALYFE